MCGRKHNINIISMDSNTANIFEDEEIRNSFPDFLDGEEDE